MGEVSRTRLYLGNLPKNATKADVEKHFGQHGTGTITEIKLMQGFGFIEYEDPMDAQDVVPDGSDFMGQRLTVQFARGNRQPDGYPDPARPTPRPRRTAFKLQISGLPVETSWQDLKDFARQSSLDVVYSETGRERDGRGFVEFETEADLKVAVEKLNGRDFKGSRVTCVAEIGSNEPRPRERYARSLSPPSRRGGYPPLPEEYERHARGYSPGRVPYRDRSPPRRGYYDARYRSPPRRGGGDGGSMGGYGPPPPRRDYPDDPYDPRPPRRGYEPEPYMNGGGGGGGGHHHHHHHHRPYEGRPPSPRGRPRSPPGREYHDYSRRGWY